jgi:hypothetical protein
MNHFDKVQPVQTYIICNRADRVPSTIQITALATSVLMILVGQAKTWYANDPENNVIRDIKRKVVIALFLMIPNFAVLGKLSCYPC